MTFHATPDIAYVNHFFPCELIILFKSIQVKQVDVETLLLAWLGTCQKLAGGEGGGWEF